MPYFEQLGLCLQFLAKNFDSATDILEGASRYLHKLTEEEKALLYAGSFGRKM